MKLFPPVPGHLFRGGSAAHCVAWGPGFLHLLTTHWAGAMRGGGVCGREAEADACQGNELGIRQGHARMAGKQPPGARGLSREEVCLLYLAGVSGETFCRSNEVNEGMYVSCLVGL